MSAVAQSKLDRAALEQIVREVVTQRIRGNGKPSVEPSRPNLVVNISARHMHCTQHTLETLFGPGAKLTVMRDLYQKGQFASEQTVTIIGPRHRTITNLRILGPCRNLDQIELAFTDGIAMGLDLPIRMSGNVKGSPGCIVLGPKGYVELKEGVVRAMRHVHMNPRDAEFYKVKNGDKMALRVENECPTVFEEVIARIHEDFLLEVHLDTDEGNASNLAKAKRVELIKQ